MSALLHSSTIRISSVRWLQSICKSAVWIKFTVFRLRLSFPAVVFFISCCPLRDGVIPSALYDYYTRIPVFCQRLDVCRTTYVEKLSELLCFVAVEFYYGTQKGVFCSVPGLVLVAVIVFCGKPVQIGEQFIERILLQLCKCV